MTRWARPSQGKWKRPEEATSWTELKATLNSPLKKIKSEPTGSPIASTKINQKDDIKKDNRLAEVFVTQNLTFKKLLSATEQKGKSAKKNIQNQLRNTNVGNPKIKFNKRIAKERLLNQEIEKFTAVKKNKKSPQSLNIKKKKLIRKKGQIKMELQDGFIAKREMTGDESSTSQKNENSTVKDKREVKSGLLSKTRNTLKNSPTLDVREIKTELSEDNNIDENNLQNKNETENNDIEVVNDTDENEIEQNINNHLDQNVSKNLITEVHELHTKDEQIRSPVHKVKNRVNRNKLLKTILSKNRLKLQKFPSEFINKTLTENKANFAPERIQVFHNKRYKWVNQTIVGVQAENPNLPKEDINEILYKMEKKNSKKGRFYCRLCQVSNHTIDSCPLTKKNPAIAKPYQHSKKDRASRCTDKDKVRSGSCFECGSIEHYKHNCPTLKKQIKKHQDKVLCPQDDRESVEDYPASDETIAKDQPRQVPMIIKRKTQSPYKSKARFNGSPLVSLKQQPKVKVPSKNAHQHKIGGIVFF